MAGVRIYCRGKIAAQTAVFNMKAGFTGEHDVRSYFIGELHADWLDEDDDLIRTDRQDILWSHDLGVAFQAWGQLLVKIVGRITREPMRKSAWERFQQVSKINERVPTFEVDGLRLMKRITLIVSLGRIEQVFYPVFPPNESAGEVLRWLAKAT